MQSPVNSKKCDNKSQAREKKFNPVEASACVRQAPRWISLNCMPVQIPTLSLPRAEDVAAGQAPSDIQVMAFRDSSYFVAGQIHHHQSEWDIVLPHSDQGNMVRSWIAEGINVFSFFRPFKGNFRGNSYNSEEPLPNRFPNSASCNSYEAFVSKTLEEWIKCGAVRVLGKVGEVEPPRVIMPLTVEPSKPRLCHDERYLNLWVKDLPFTLDTLKEVPRVVGKNCYMTCIDHKSGYQHVRLTKNSETYFGICWQGFYLVYTTLPFGFKASCYIYHTLSTMVVSYGRELGVPSLIYIDDCMNTELASQVNGDQKTSEQRAAAAIYIMCQLWCRLGYTLSLSKGVFVPTKELRFLGLVINSALPAFLVPDDKKATFKSLREQILEGSTVSVKTLQRFQGKCMSLTLVVPAARLYISEISRKLAAGEKNSRLVELTAELRHEIEHWRFLDSWTGHVSWRPEKHLQVVSLATDASSYKWGAVVGLDDDRSRQELADFWQVGDDRPIHVKEAEALLATLKSVSQRLAGHRVDAYLDNMAVVDAWSRFRIKDQRLAKIIKAIFQVVTELNIDLSLQYIPSVENPADAPSRSLSWADAMLGSDSWRMVEHAFGPHSVDLMATDANAMKRGGNCLRHFTPYPTPLSDGVNVFAQDLRNEVNPYCYPPICLIGALLIYLQESGVKQCTMVIPRLFPNPSWWPMLQKMVVKRLMLGRKSQTGIVWVPTKNGYVPDAWGLRWDLEAVRLIF